MGYISVQFIYNYTQGNIVILSSTWCHVAENQVSITR